MTSDLAQNFPKVYRKRELIIHYSIIYSPH